MITDVWERIVWKEKPIPGKKQKRLIPTIPDYSFKKQIRARYVKGWMYSKHWVDSALKTAFSIVKSWRKNYLKGTRKRRKPVVVRSFVRVKQTLYKLEGNKLRISIKPREFVYVDLSKRYFSLVGKMGEPILTPAKIHVPIHQLKEDVPIREEIGWDSNKFSMDGYSTERGWIKIDLKPLHTLHITYDNKFRSINRVYARNKRKGKQLYQKYRKRCRNRVKNYLCRLAREMTSIPAKHGFERLEKQTMNRPHRRRWNRELNHADWRKLFFLVSNLASVVQVDPRYTSKTCSRCGALHKSLRSERVFECPKCGLAIDRQFNASINLYLRMRGASPQKERFDATIAGGLPLIGAETSGSDELARKRDELRMPQVYVRLPLST